MLRLRLFKKNQCGNSFTPFYIQTAMRPKFFKNLWKLPEKSTLLLNMLPYKRFAIFGLLKVYIFPKNEIHYNHFTIFFSKFEGTFTISGILQSIFESLSLPITKELDLRMKFFTHPIHNCCHSCYKSKCSPGSYQDDPPLCFVGFWRNELFWFDE